MAQEHTVDKGIFKFWSAPNAALVLLGIFVSLSVAVLAESWPEVQRVDGRLGSSLISRLLARSRNSVEAVE
jgi:hypothetical protein